MTNSADPDQVASSQLIWIYTVYIDKAYPGSAGPGLRSTGLYFGFYCRSAFEIPFCMFWDDEFATYKEESTSETQRDEMCKYWIEVKVRNRNVDWTTVTWTTCTPRENIVQKVFIINVWLFYTRPSYMFRFIHGNTPNNEIRKHLIGNHRANAANLWLRQGAPFRAYT